VHSFASFAFTESFAFAAPQWLNTAYELLDAIVDEYGGKVTKVETVRLSW
jgi:hypothetical protein